MSAPALVHDPASGMLRSGSRPVLRLAAGWTVQQDPEGNGLFLRLQPSEQAAYTEQALGRLQAMTRFTSLYRFAPFWTRPAVGHRASQVQPETLCLLVQAGSDHYSLIVPLLDQRSRCSLRATAAAGADVDADADADVLAVAAETGDPGSACPGGVAVFVKAGADPYTLVAAAARSVQRQLAPLGKGRLRLDKPLPDFVDLFGWCTWDAFYKDVSPEKLLDGLASFERAGVSPRLLILDDGWQAWTRAGSGEDRLQSLAANQRFGGDLAALADAVKSRFGVQKLLVWQALLGYWGGLDEAAFAEFGVCSVAKSFGPGLLAQQPRWNVWPWGAQIGVPAADQLAAFYERWHAQLAAQGVDDVKVDAQGLLEGVSAGQGGRVAMALAARRALEASVGRHFGGRLINCMSCTQECVYLSADSVLMRCSDDFFPQRSDSHGLHLFVNALAGLWFGEFMLPDWDMFQSLHSHGSFHAAARAISGGAVYVSDEPGEYDAALLRQLVLSDALVLRADRPARPTPDSLFADPTCDPQLLKLFNHNRDAGVVGLFNARSSGGSLSGSASLADLPDLPGLRQAEDCIAWARWLDRLWTCAETAPPTITLAPGEWELVSFAPIERGFAAIGLADKPNSGGAIGERRWTDSACELQLREGGDFLAWAQLRPATLLCDGQAIDFQHEAASGRLRAALPVGGPRRLQLRWPAPSQTLAHR